MIFVNNEYYTDSNNIVGNYIYGPSQVMTGTIGSGTVISNNVMSIEGTTDGFGNIVADDVTCTNIQFVFNTVYFDGTRNHNFLPMLSTVNYSNTNMTFDHNQYYSNPTNSVTGGYVVFRTNNVNVSWGQWQTNLNLDLHGTLAEMTFPPDSVGVFPNLDQPKRANIGIFNWTLKHNVAVNLAGVLTAGDSYQLINAENYKAGAIQTGTYNGTNILVPMTNLTVVPVQYGYGTTNTRDGGLWLPTNTISSPEFGAFVVIGSIQVPLPPNKFRVLSSP